MKPSGAQRAGKALVAVIAAGPWYAAAGQTMVHLRGGTRTVEASEVRASADGLAVTTSLGEQLLPWHLVGRLEGEGAASAKPYADAAEDAWRGLARFERGDLVAAEAPLQRAYAALGRGRASETAAELAEGLLRCRLAAGRTTGVIEPWLTLLACETAGTWSPARSEGLVDSQTGLLPALSPSLYVGLPSAQPDVLTEDRTDAMSESDRSREMASLYAAAIAFERGRDVTLDAADGASPGVALLHAVVEARTADETGRRIARRALWDVLLSDRPEWQRAWAEAGLGFSLLREGAGSELEAVAHLLAVPAVHGDRLPLLAGVCLAEAAGAMDALGRAEDAYALVRELARRFPGHPSIDRPEVQRFLQQNSSGARRARSDAQDEASE